MLTNALTRGQQIGTYRLQLPYRYSILLIILSAVMHFLLSESSFVVLFTDGMYLDEYAAQRFDTHTLTLNIRRLDQWKGQLEGLPNPAI